VISGGAGDDVIWGMRFADRDSPLPDRLDGGPGNDTIYGGPGADTLSCGPGRDTVVTDAQDRVAKDCEVVKHA
jgi:Ca2+-binding RTX toxin-like protein